MKPGFTKWQLKFEYILEIFIVNMVIAVISLILQKCVL